MEHKPFSLKPEYFQKDLRESRTVSKCQHHCGFCQQTWHLANEHGRAPTMAKAAQQIEQWMGTSTISTENIHTVRLQKTLISQRGGWWIWEMKPMWTESQYSVSEVSTGLRTQDETSNFCSRHIRPTLTKLVSLCSCWSHAKEFLCWRWKQFQRNVLQCVFFPTMSTCARKSFTRGYDTHRLCAWCPGSFCEHFLSPTGLPGAM